MNDVFLLIGGNLGDRLQNLQAAFKAIAQLGTVVASSAVYETAAWGNEDQPGFLNQALQLETVLTASSLLRKLLAIEQSLGRVRAEKNGPRTIDIDILLYNQHIINLPHLQVPHPHMAQRRFVLQPLAEIAADLVHPTNHQTIGQLLAACPDPLDVKKFSV